MSILKKNKLDKNILLLSIIFFFVFLGYSSVQQFVTSYFVDLWMNKLGFYSLILVYLGFLVWNLFLVWFVQKIGSKKSILFSIIFYFIYIFLLLIPNTYIILFSSFLLWLSASFLWIWQQTYIIKLSKWKNVWNNFAIINIFLFLGASVWSILLWKLIWFYGYSFSFFIFWFFPFIWMIIAYFLDDFSLKSDNPKEINKNTFKLLKYFKNLDLLRLGFFYASITFTTWLFFSVIPIHIKELFWVDYIWTITFIFYGLVMFFLFFSWKIVDNYNHKKIIIFLSFISFLSMFFMFLYKEFAYIIYLWIFILAICYSIINPLVWALISDLSSKNNTELLSSFFLIFSNLWIILWITISSFINTKMIYLISILFIFITLITFLSLYKKDFWEIKKVIK